MSNSTTNVDPAETAKFEQMAATWWDPEGDCRPLHDINGPRVDYMASRVQLSDQAVADVGCGGGLLSEALARRGAEVTGIDLAKRAIDVAIMHAELSELKIDYRCCDAKALSAEKSEAFSVVACLEALEHVPKPQELVEDCATLVAPGGHLFFSTLNRHPLAFVGAIVGAEHVLGLLPKGTHRYDRFIRPSELAGWCRTLGLVVHDITGLHYNPFSRTVRLGNPPVVNYLLHAQKPHD